MGGGAFRDAGAAIERVAILEQEKDELEAELAKLREEIEERRGDDEANRDPRRELANAKAELASERAARKKELRELLPVAKKLEAAESAFHAANTERKIAVYEAEQASEELAAVRDQLHDAKQRIDELEEELREQRRRADLGAPSPVTQVPENLGAYMKRAQEERDELREEVRRLRDELAAKPRPSLLATLFGRR